MAETSLNQLLTLINQQVEFQEALNEQLSKAEALAYIAISSDLLEHPKTIIHYFLWVLSDLIELARLTNEQSLEALISQKPLPDMGV